MAGQALHDEQISAGTHGSVGGSAESTASPSQREAGEGSLASFAT